ncbi:unnamed protein product [Lepeophtheirus salmonis]|uniref:(salmon louse) hypothetical protein n=1 Tax=Lepeophtheirus salmonis TaxID=72036 RepID=A0A7R8CUD7_LEPSM|nr:unnamed protein product [Lepeophtheirus salmonis]CAF2899229.1 unnamed protein product [Lepeophtheirus salmonis]
MVWIKRSESGDLWIVENSFYFLKCMKLGNGCDSFWISLLFLIVSVLLALFGVKGANGIQCYECSGTYGNTIMNVCRAGHIGERKNCSSEVKNCYKSRTTEAVPKLARRCGTTKKSSKYLPRSQYWK